MSRIGKKHIDIPAGVTVTVNGCAVTVKGPKGELTKEFENVVKINVENNQITFTPVDDEKHSHQMHGTARAIVNNMVNGVVNGYEKKLTIIGTGYHADLKNGGIDLALGYSHHIKVDAPKGITFEVPAPDTVIVKGIDKELVGQISAEIRDYRKPEPYHGKGVRYADENVRRKEIKKAAK